jgi:hypothetical protein
VLIASSRGFTQDKPRGNIEKLGDVHFVTSCNEPAQKEFDRAVALLHSFQFSNAITGFKATLEDDPSCAIAYWGIALSDWSNPFEPGIKGADQLKLGRESAERGKNLGAKTAREQAYLLAVSQLYEKYESIPQHTRLVAYRDAMEGLATRYPDDHEAKIFYALSLAVAADPGDKTYADELKAGAILENLFAQQPTHPGLAHYIIHAYDVPGLAGRALVAAQRYAIIAPSTPHALHMPSHTFTRLGYWDESISSNIAAAAAAKRQGQTVGELHASDYEIYAYLQTGQDQAAERIVKTLPEIASRFDPSAVFVAAGPPSAGFFAIAAIPARYALERHDWSQAQRLDLHLSPFPQADATTWFARGLGAARLGHHLEAEEAATALKQIQEHLMHTKEVYWGKQVEIQAAAVEAWSAFAAGARKQALRRMELAAAMEDGTEKSAVTPGPLAPARELLGDMLLAMNEPTKALQQYEATLRKEPRRFRSLFGAAHSARLAGVTEKSRQYFRQLLEVCSKADDPGRPELSEARAALGV